MGEMGECCRGSVVCELGLRDGESPLEDAALGVTYDGYEEWGDGTEGNSEGISTSGVPFVDVPRWKLDDDGWRSEDGWVLRLRVGSGALHRRGDSGIGGRTSSLRF